MAFNINAAVVLSGPKNIQKVRGTIEKQLKSINVPIDIKLNRGVTTGVGNLNKSLQKLNTTLATVNTNAAKATASLNALGNAGKNIGTAATQVNSATSKVNKSLNQTAKSANIAGTAMQDFGKDAALAVRRFSAFSLATGVIFGFTRAVTSSISEAVKFERELVKITQVTGAAGKQLTGLRKIVDDLSTGLGISASELLDVGRTFAQTGQSLDQVQKSLSAVARVSLAPTFGDIRKTTEGAIAALNQFGLGADKLEGILGSLNQVSKKFAVESEDLISVIRRAGGVFAASTSQLGAPEERLRELIGVFTAVRSTTRESADTIATGLRNIFTRLQRPQTIEFLKQFGVQIRATAEDAQKLGIAEGEFIGIFEALKRISKASKNLDTLQTARLVEELGGVRQVGKLIPALKNFEKAEKAVQVALEGRTSIAKDVGLATQTLAVQLQNLSNQFDKLFRDISESRTFQSLAKTAISTASAILSITDALRPILPALTAIAAVKLGTGAIGFFQGFAGGFKKGGGAKGVGAGLAGIATGGSSSAQQSANRQQSISALKSNTSSLNSNTTALKALNTSIGTLQRSSTTLNTSATALTSTLKSLPAQIAAASRGRGITTAPIPLKRRRAAGGNIPKFADGGFVKGPSHSQGGVVAELEGGELVVPKKQAQKLAFGGLTKAALSRSSAGRSLGGTSDLFTRNTAVDAKFPLQTTTAFGKFLNRVDLPGSSQASKAQRFGNLPSQQQKDLVKKFRGQGKKTNKAAATAGKDKNIKRFTVTNSDQIGLFLLSGGTERIAAPPDGLTLTGTGLESAASKAKLGKIPKTGTLASINPAGFPAFKIGSRTDIALDMEQDFRDASDLALEAAISAIYNNDFAEKVGIAPFNLQDKKNFTIEKQFSEQRGNFEGILLEAVLNAVGDFKPTADKAAFDIQPSDGDFSPIAKLFEPDAAIGKIKAAEAKRSRDTIRKGDNRFVNKVARSPIGRITARNGRKIPGDGMTPVAVSNGEGVIAPNVAKGNLLDLEKARKGDAEAISRIANLPISTIKGQGTGTSDSIQGELPANSFVLPSSTMKKLDGRQNLRVGGAVKAAAGALKRDPGTAIFLGLEGSVLASSQSLEEFKSNLINAGLGLALLAPQLKELTKDISDAGKNVQKASGPKNLRAATIAARQKTGQSVLQSSGARASIGLGKRVLTAANADDFGIARGKSGIGKATKQLIGEAEGNLLRKAEKETAKANKLISERNSIVAKANSAAKVEADALARNKAVNEAARANAEKLSKVNARRATIVSKGNAATAKLANLETRASALANKSLALQGDVNLAKQSLKDAEKRLAKAQSPSNQLTVGRQGQASMRGFSAGQAGLPAEELKRSKDSLRAAEQNLANLEKQLVQTSKASTRATTAVAKQAQYIDGLKTNLSSANKEAQGLTKTLQAQAKESRLTAKVATSARGTGNALRGKASSLLRGVGIARDRATTATGNLKTFNAAARAEDARRAANAKARTARIADKGGLSAEQRLARVRQVRLRRGSIKAGGLFGEKGLQGLGNAGRVGGSGIANAASKTGNVLKAGLGGPAGIAALLAGLFGDAVVDAGTKVAVGEQKQFGGVKGFTPGQGGRTAAGVTGGLKGGISGAATGASIGLLTGPLSPVLTPLFAAIGGVAGAIDGFIKAIDQQIKFESLSKLDNAANNLTSALDTLAQKGFSNVAALDAVSKQAGSLNTQFAQTVATLNAVDTNTGSTGTEAFFKSINKSISNFTSNIGNADPGLFAKSRAFGDAIGLGGKAGEKRVQQRQAIGGLQGIGGNIDSALSTISDEVLQRSVEQFNALGSELVSSINLSDVTEIASLSGGSFDQLVDALKTAGGESDKFNAQLQAFQKLAGTTALAAVKQLSASFNEQSQSFSNQGRAQGFFAIGKDAANAIADGLSRGQSFAEAGERANQKLISGFSRLGVSETELKKSFGIDSFEDLQRVATDGGAKLTLLAQALGVSTREIRVLANDTSNFAKEVERLSVEQSAAAAKQAIVNDLIRAQTANMDAFAAALEDLDGRIGNIISDFTTTATNVQNEVSRIFSTQQNFQAVGRANVFEGGARGRSASQLDAGVERVRSAVGGDPEDFADLSGVIQLGNELPQALKDTADELRRSGKEFTFEDFRDALIDNLNSEGNIFANAGEIVQGQLINGIESVFVGLRQGSDALGVDALEKVLQESGDVQGQLVELSGKTASTLANITNGLNTLNASILQSANLIVESSRQRVDAELSIADRRSSFEDQFAQFRTGGPDKLTTARQRLQQRTDILLNAGGAGTATAGGVNLGGVGGGDLLQRRTGLEDIRKGILDKIGEVTGVDTTSTEDAVTAAQGVAGTDQLITELGNVNSALEGTKRAIEEQTNETARLSAIEDRLASINESRLSQRQRMQAGLQQLSGARNPQEVNKILNDLQRPLIAASKAAAGQALSVQEGAALQADLFDQQGIVATSFRQQNPNASDEDVSKFLEQSLANFQEGGRNLFSNLGLGNLSVDALFGKSRAEGGLGATEKGTTKGEKTALSEAEKIVQQQADLVAGYVDQNTKLLEIQQDIYRQEIIKTTQSLIEASTAFGDLRDKQQELLSTAQARTAQLEAATVGEQRTKNQKDLVKTEKELANAREQQQQRERGFSQISEARTGLGGLSFIEDVLKAGGQSQKSINEAISGATIKSVESSALFGDTITEFSPQEKNERFASLLAKSITNTKFGGENSEESGKFRSKLFEDIKRTLGSKNFSNTKGLAGEVKSVIEKSLGDEVGISSTIKEKEEEAKKIRESIAVQDEQINSAQARQKQFEQQANEQAKTAEANKKARQEAAKQQVATTTSPAGIGPAEAAERQRQADRDKRLAEIRENVNSAGASVPNGPGISEERRAEIRARAEAEDQAAIDAARAKDQASRDAVPEGRAPVGGSLGSLTDPISQEDQAASQEMLQRTTARPNSLRSRTAARLARQRGLQQTSVGVTTNVGQGFSVSSPIREQDIATQSRNEAASRRQGLQSVADAPSRNQRTRAGGRVETDVQTKTQDNTAIQTLADAVNQITTSTFASDLLQAANKLSELGTLQVEFNGTIKPIEVILNGASLFREVKEGIKQELIPLIQQAVSDKLNDINL
jgi:hypothetical protein